MPEGQISVVYVARCMLADISPGECRP